MDVESGCRKWMQKVEASYFNVKAALLPPQYKSYVLVKEEDKKETTSACRITNIMEENQRPMIKYSRDLHNYSDCSIR